MSLSARGREHYSMQPLDTERSSTVISARSDDYHLRLTRTSNNPHRRPHKSRSLERAVSEAGYFREDRRRSRGRSLPRADHHHRSRGEHGRSRDHDPTSYVRTGSSLRERDDPARDRHHLRQYASAAHFPTLSMPALAGMRPRRSLSADHAMHLVPSPYNDVIPAGKASPMLRMGLPNRSYIFETPMGMRGTYDLYAAHRARMTPRTALAQTMTLGANPASKLDHFTEATMVPQRDVVTMNLRDTRGTPYFRGA
ncbi:unnamed protein product [Amoebophrya sp. A25]|nr:unnamed protein product [Amoebophrya sp. A25]|eukprot:GSA25T00024819001.1